MLFFDAQGHLTPYGLIQTDWQTVVTTFGWNAHRQLLLEQLRSFIDNVNFVDPFTIWIDGSFVTSKEWPTDIDVVLLLPTPVYHTQERSLRKLREQFDKLDLYTVRKIDPSEHDYFFYLSDQAEWIFQFTMTRPDRLTRRKFLKGFLQITWPNEPTT